jgi:hypothetical protein
MASTLAMREFKRITLGSSDVLTRLDFPVDAHRLTVQFITNDGKLTHTGTDAEAIGSHYFTCQSDTTYEFDLVDTAAKGAVRSGFSLYVASATGSTVVEVFVE